MVQCAMATVRLRANGGIPTPISISMGLNAIPHHHTPHKEVLHLFHATKATPDPTEPYAVTGIEGAQQYQSHVTQT